MGENPYAPSTTTALAGRRLTARRALITGAFVVLTVLVADIYVMYGNHDLGAFAWMLNLPALPILVLYYTVPMDFGDFAIRAAAVKVTSIGVSSLGWGLVAWTAFRLAFMRG